MVIFKQPLDLDLAIENCYLSYNNSQDITKEHIKKLLLHADDETIRFWMGKRKSTITYKIVNCLEERYREA